MARTGLPLVPPNPFVDAVTHFFLGVLLGPAMVMASAVCFIPYAFTHIAGTGSSNPTEDVLGVFFLIVALLFACTLLGAAAYSHFKNRSGRPLPFSLGIFVGLAAWAIILPTEKDESAFPFVLAVIGLVLAGIGFWSAKRGLAAHHRKFRPGSGNCCAHCHYDLSGTAEHKPCPECGGQIRYDLPSKK